MTTRFDRWLLPGISAALLLAQSAVMAADRMMVQHSKQSTAAESGLGYEFTFRVTKHGSGDPVDGAEFSVSTDMPSMPGAHHMPPVAGEPTGEPGTYRAEVDFDMPGEVEPHPEVQEAEPRPGRDLRYDREGSRVSRTMRCTAWTTPVPT